jgi:hypothetical protein
METIRLYCLQIWLNISFIDIIFIPCKQAFIDISLKVKIDTETDLYCREWEIMETKTGSKDGCDSNI